MMVTADEIMVDLLAMPLTQKIKVGEHTYRVTHAVADESVVPERAPHVGSLLVVVHWLDVEGYLAGSDYWEFVGRYLSEPHSRYEAMAEAAAGMIHKHYEMLLEGM